METQTKELSNVQTLIMHKDLFASMNIVITPSMEVRTLFDGDMLIIEDKNLSKQSRLDNPNYEEDLNQQATKLYNQIQEYNELQKALKAQSNN